MDNISWAQITCHSGARRLMRMGIRNTVIAITMCLVMGFLLGLLFSPFARRMNWPTPEMTGRGQTSTLIAGAVVATASGFVVGLGVTGGGINSLVGVAISASLLPPIVNCGMMCAFAVLGPSLFDCLGQERFSWFGEPKRFVEAVTPTGFSHMKEVSVGKEACSVSSCGVWDYEDLYNCNTTASHSCACVELTMHASKISPDVSFTVLCKFVTTFVLIPALGLQLVSPWNFGDSVQKFGRFERSDYVAQGLKSFGVFVLSWLSLTRYNMPLTTLFVASFIWSQFCYYLLYLPNRLPY